MKSIVISFLIVLSAITAAAQQPSPSPTPIPTNYAELRAGTSGHGLSYGFAQYSKRFGQNDRWVWDNFLIHTPGQEEFLTGLGYDFKVKSEKHHIDLIVTPTLYGVVGRNENEAGLAIGGTIVGPVKRVNVSAFIAHFVRLRGSVPDYTFGDSIDATTAISKNWEAGGSLGFFCQSGSCGKLAGPMVKRSDGHGSWGAMFRVGSDKEFQFRRTFIF